MYELGSRTLTLDAQDYMPGTVAGCLLVKGVPFSSAVDHYNLSEKDFECLMQTNKGKYMKGWAENNGFDIVFRKYGLALQVNKEFDLCVHFDNLDEMGGWIRGLYQGKDFVLNGGKMVISEQCRKEAIEFALENRLRINSDE